MKAETNHISGAFVWGATAVIVVLGLLGLWAIMGCTTGQLEREIDRIKDVEWDVTPTTTTTTTTTQPPPAPEPGAYVPRPGDVNANLWKPKADTRGGAAALFAAKWRPLDGCTMHNEKHVEYAGETNGGRPTFFMGRVGSAYPAPSTLVGWRGSEKIVELRIANPGQRTTLATGWQRLKSFFGADVGIEYVEVGI